MKLLRRGVRDPQVKYAQHLVNEELSPTPPLAEDGIFGPKTEEGVRAFQGRSRRLRVDGLVGPNTWRELGVRTEIDHPVRLFPQPTGMSCWSAAATMLFGDMSVGPGSAATSSSGGLGSSPTNVQAFADSHGLRMHHPQSWSVQGLSMILRRGPIWVGGINPVAGKPAGHALVVGALWSDGAPGGDGTMIKIYDPWPPGRGEIRGEIFSDWSRRYPLSTMYVLERP